MGGGVGGEEERFGTKSLDRVSSHVGVVEMRTFGPLILEMIVWSPSAMVVWSSNFKDNGFLGCPLAPLVLLEPPVLVP